MRLASNKREEHKIVPIAASTAVGTLFGIKKSFNAPSALYTVHKIKGENKKFITDAFIRSAAITMSSENSLDSAIEAAKYGPKEIIKSALDAIKNPSEQNRKRFQELFEAGEEFISKSFDSTYVKNAPENAKWGARAIQKGNLIQKAGIIGKCALVGTCIGIAASTIYRSVKKFMKQPDLTK